ncbi:MAG TPA: metabolite traffic protein EboE [Planctomycetota bacterium]|jgi:hypothetical protein|nr:metabolite traffic protein EboE [Planctomycetota bacterium]
MLWTHSDHPRARVRLAYCLNVHAAEEFAQMLAGMRDVTLPLRDRVARRDEPFGAGLYLPARLARRLASESGAGDLARLVELVVENGLDPFTYNAFPAGGFHADGLKSAVFRPTWMEEDRVRFTLDVAHVAAHVARAAGGPARSHVSISTHTGAFGADVRGEEDLRACARNLARAAAGLAAIEERTGTRIVLSLEAEPRALCGDNASLARFLASLPERCAGAAPEAVLRRHLGACLDACHSAVEFEDPAEAFELATASGPLGKLQFSSALALVDPAASAGARAVLLATDEPRYLHQVTGLAPDGRCEASDLPELARALDPERAPSTDWLACPEWRCHFHVPVDLAALGESGLATTRDHADRILAVALAHPELWGVAELHLEIETYTWDVLPGPARGTGELADGLEREYLHVIARLEAAGWRRSSAPFR